MSSTKTALSLQHYPYRSRRIPVFGARGVVATSEPLAAQAGLRMLQKGGNAVDAAIATAVALTVVEPTCNGIGGDALGLVWDGGKLHGIDGIGKAPATHSPSLFSKQGLNHIPNRGWLPVTVPGGPAAWGEMHEKFGKLPFEELFEPAIEYAEQGFPVGPLTAQRWKSAAAVYARTVGDEESLRPWREAFTRDGRAPEPGDMWALPQMVSTLRELGATRCESFYRGALARRIVEFVERTGGYLTAKELAEHKSSWVDPIKTSYRGYDVWEMPPTSQGIAALSALNILEGFELGKLPRDSVEAVHLQLEAIKIALGDAYNYLADPAVSDVPWQERLSRAWAEKQRALISDTALPTPPVEPSVGGTVYLCTADADGMMVSFIQSNYSGWMIGFGSGVVLPDAGIAFHARACGFTLNPRHPNVIAPGKRPFHTLAPSFLSRDGRAEGPFGIMGGPVQPQGQVQFIVNQIDYGMNPQAALDAPRFQWIKDNRVEVELDLPGGVMQGLVERGHDVSPCVDFAAMPPQLGRGDLGTGLLRSGDFGKAQIIRRLPSGAYVAGSDWRSDGCAVAY